MKKLFTKIILLLIIPFVSTIGYSSWIIIGNKNFDVGVAPVEGNDSVLVREVAYITNSTITSKTDEYTYTSIEKALKVANSGDTVNVILNNSTDNPTVIQYDCVVKEGVTLNIPYEEGVTQEKDSEGKMTATGSGSSLANDTSTTNIVKVRENTTITNNGKIIIGGILSPGGSSSYSGQTSSYHAKLIMGKNSVINSKGEIWCCGFINEETKNNGSYINAESGTLELPFILRDFRGGSTSYAISKTNSDLEISPFNQFEISNIHCTYYINYNADLIGYANITAQDTKFPTTVNLIGSGDSCFFSLSNENCYAKIKFDVSTQICCYDLYGGATLNSISLELSFNIVLTDIKVNITTAQCYFPISWRMNLNLHKYENQSDIAEFNSEDQKVKLLPGSKFVIDQGCNFKVQYMNVYSYFSENLSGENIGGNKYNTSNLTKKPAEFIVNGMFECSEKFGGRLIYSDLKNINISGEKTITTNEAYTQEGSNISTKITDYFLINEIYTPISYGEYMTTSSLVLGVMQTNKLQKPTYSIVSDEIQKSLDNIPSLSNKENINYNLCLNVKKQIVFTPNLKTNISTSNYNGTYYVLGNQLNFENESLFEMVCSSEAASQMIMTGIAVSGNNAVAIGGTTQLSATPIPATAYTKSFSWSIDSSTQDIATISSTGLVTAKQMGKAIIIVTSNDSYGITSTYEITITDPNALVSIASLTSSTESFTSNAFTKFEATITINYNPSSPNNLDKYEFTWEISGGTVTTKNVSTDTRSCYIVLPARKVYQSALDYKLVVTAVANDSSLPTGFSYTQTITCKAW